MPSLLQNVLASCWYPEGKSQELSLPRVPVESRDLSYKIACSRRERFLQPFGRNHFGQNILGHKRLTQLQLLAWARTELLGRHCKERIDKANQCTSLAAALDCFSGYTPYEHYIVCHLSQLPSRGDTLPGAPADRGPSAWPIRDRLQKHDRELREIRTIATCLDNQKVRKSAHDLLGHIV